MGFPKVFTALDERSPLARIGAVLGERPAICVVQQQHLNDAIAQAPEMQVVVNDAPHRGMTHSLRLALEAIPPDRAVGVILADMPLLDDALLDALEHAAESSGADIVYPQRADGTPGHPVLFSPRARALAARLADGDTLRLIRDDASLTRCVVPYELPAAFCDLDHPAEWDAFGELL